MMASTLMREEDKMKISKRHLKRIIKEEKARLLSEQSREAKEGSMLADLNSVVTSIEEIAAGLYGLQDPGEPGVQVGDDMAQDLEMQIERLNQFFRSLEAHFESSEFNPNAPGMR